MQLFVREKQFYRTLASIALPIAAQNLINFGITMADTVMLGMLGEVELSAASIANQLGFVFLLVIFGVGSGSGVMIAQFWGKGDISPIHRVMTVMYRFVIVASVLFTAVAMLAPIQVMSVFTTDAAVIMAGADYLRIVGISYILSGFTTGTVFVLRGAGSVRISVAVYSASLCTNVILNYGLIFGKFGLPELGVKGAAIATCIARCVEISIILIYLIWFEKKIQYKLRYFFWRKMNILSEYVRTALPVVINEVMWGSGTAVVAIIIGRMGTPFVAAYSISSVLSQFVTVAIFGVGHASAVIVGNTIGARQYDRVKEYAKTFMGIALILGLVSSAFVLLLKTPLIGLYNISELAKLYANQIISIYAIVVIFQAFTSMSVVGVLRGGGDTRFAMIVDVLFLWAWAIPLGFFTGLYLKLPIPIVYAVIKSELIFSSTLCIWRVKSMNWIHDVTKISTE